MKYLFFTILSFCMVTTIVAQNITNVSPNSGDQGTWALPITITGSGTNFSAATSTVVKIKQGTNTLQILAVNYIVSDTVKVDVNISNSSPLGSYSVEVYDLNSAGYTALPNGFTVTTNSLPPSNLAVTPNVASYVSILPVTISTANMHFTQATDNMMYLSQGTNTLIFPNPSSTSALNDNYLKAWFNFGNYGLAIGDVLNAHYGNSFDGYFTVPNAITITDSSYISGIIDFADTTHGIVEVYHKNTNVTPNTYSLVSSVNVQAGNDYHVPNLAVSSYLLRYVPTVLSNQLVATYYPSNIDWQNASLVTTVAGQSSNSYDIVPFLAANLTGGTVVNGAIGYGPNGFTKSTLTMAEGLEVFLFNVDDGTYAQSITDVNGVYEFNGVSNGAYSIVVNLPGYEQISTYNFIVLDESNDFLNLNFAIDNGEIFKTNTLSVGKQGRQSLVAYPNPTSGEIRISIPNNISNFQAEIFSLTGRKVWSQNVTDNHSQLLKADLSDLSNGIYVVNITSEHENYQVKVVVKN